MICFFCHRAVTGKDVALRYEWRGTVNGRAVYGKGELPLSEAHGRLLKVSHNKCYHASKKQAELASARAADPSAQPQPEQDWRHQEIVDVEDLQGADNGDHRGAGASGS
jgi:hypothetical protein